MTGRAYTAVNPYLTSLNTKYENLNASIAGLQTRAVEQGRDLTDDELAMVRSQGKAAEVLFTQITELTDIETRNAKVHQMAATVNAAMNGTATGQPGDQKVGTPVGDNAGGDQTRSRTTGGATTQDRDPGHYQRGGQHSFFKDLVRSRAHDHEALQRIAEHTRALDSTGAGAGIVPPKWLIEEFAEQARQGRALAAAVRNIPLGDDPRPLTLPKQTSGADSTNPAEQESENDPIPSTNKFATNVDTVTPTATSGSQLVSRQLLDMANPAIDQLVYGDLIAEYNLQVERKVGAAVMAVGTPLTAAEDVEITDPTHYTKVALRAAVAIRKARKMRATLFAMSVGRHGEFLNLTDSTGRPLIPDGSDGPMNAFGIGSIVVDGRFRGLGIIATEGVPDDNEFAAVKASDVLLFESNMMRFRYEESNGPESVRLGIWAYTATLVRYGTAPVKLISIEES